MRQFCAVVAIAYTAWGCYIFTYSFEGFTRACCEISKDKLSRFFCVFMGLAEMQVLELCYCSIGVFLHPKKLVL